MQLRIFAFIFPLLCRPEHCSLNHGKQMNTALAARRSCGAPTPESKPPGLRVCSCIVSAIRFWGLALNQTTEASSASVDASSRVMTQPFFSHDGSGELQAMAASSSSSVPQAMAATQAPEDAEATFEAARVPGGPEGETQVETLFTFCDNCGASFLHPSSFVPVTAAELNRETNMTCCKRRPPANMVARSRARG